MNIDKFDNYRLNKFKEISKNLKKINLMLKNNDLQTGGDITKQEINDKYDKLLDKIDEFTFKIRETEQRYARTLTNIIKIVS